MLKNEETIAAISTAIGKSAISIIRLSGLDAFNVIDKHFLSMAGKPFSHFLNEKKNRVFGYFYEKLEKKDQKLIFKRKIDQVLIFIFYAPQSYTGENLIEIHGHGGYLIPLLILDSLQKENNVRIADPGEFTRRAYMNSKIDLTQAEAIHEIIIARNRMSLLAGLSNLERRFFKEMQIFKKKIIAMMAFFQGIIDYPEDDFGTFDYTHIQERLDLLIKKLTFLLETSERFKKYKQNFRILILGKSNVGKSSLLNYLIGKERSIVSNIAGTTRDYLEEEIEFEQLNLSFIDTAGFRFETEDPIEQEGQKRTKNLIKEADCILWVLDYSRPFDEDDENIYSQLINFYKDKKEIQKKVLPLINKFDLKEKLDLERLKKKDLIFFSRISIKEKINLEDFRKSLKDFLYEKDQVSIETDVFISNLRQENIIKKIKTLLQRILEKIIKKTSYFELITEDLEEVLELLGELLGEISKEEVLDYLFAHFCLGK